MDNSVQISPASTLDLTVPLIAGNPTWTDMLAAFDGMMSVSVDSPLQQLETIRYLDASTDPGIVQKTIRMLGFDPAQDVLSMSTESLTRLVTQLPLYPNYNSTILFENFIDLLLNAVSTVEYLYTKDYVNFYPSPRGDLITEGGSWFKVTHINLYMELLHPETIDLSPGSKSIYRRIIDVFYAFCPIALVIQNFFFTIRSNVGYGFAVYMTPPDLEVVIDH